MTSSSSIVFCPSTFSLTWHHPLYNNTPIKRQIVWQSQISLWKYKGQSSWTGVASPVDDADMSGKINLMITAFTTTGVDKALVKDAIDIEPLDEVTLRYVRQRSNLLISNLQKAVRLRLHDTLMRSLYLLFATMDNPLIIKVLRRLCIIMLEDAMLHPLQPYLMFFADALYKGWIMPNRVKLFVMRGMHALCNERVPADWVCFRELPSTPTTTTATYDQMSNFEWLTLCSIGWRAAYGGMPGDLELLHDVFMKWKLRLGSRDLGATSGEASDKTVMDVWDAWSSSLSSNATVLDKISWKWNKRIDELPTAIDMHCSNIVPYLIRRCNLEISDATQLAALIWELRSSIRKRTCFCGKHKLDSNSDADISKRVIPEWWTSKVQPVIHSICIKAWAQPYSLDFTSAADKIAVRGQSSAHLSRAELLNQQLRFIAAERGVQYEPPPERASRLTMTTTSSTTDTSNSSTASVKKRKGTTTTDDLDLTAIVNPKFSILQFVGKRTKKDGQPLATAQKAAGAVTTVITIPNTTTRDENIQDSPRGTDEAFWF